MKMTRLSQNATWVAGAALIALWAASFALSYVNLGAAALPVAIAIAAAKALLVFSIFMELVLEPVSVKLALAAALSMIALLVGLMATDVATRPSPPLLPTSAGTPAR
jgi:cytochrome c oxidase subunit 4